MTNTVFVVVVLVVKDMLNLATLFTKFEDSLASPNCGYLNVWGACDSLCGAGLNLPIGVQWAL